MPVNYGVTYTQAFHAPAVFSQWEAQSGQKLILVHINATHSLVVAAMKGHFPF